MSVHTKSEPRPTHAYTGTYRPKATRQVNRVARDDYGAMPGIPSPGDVIDDKYQVLRRLGQGAMGVVLEGVDLTLDRRVAIKLVHPDLVPHLEMRQRFQDEAREMARVLHPNVVQIHAFGRLDSMDYFVMEYVPGRNLDQWAEARDELFAVDEVVGLLEQVCRGVQAIHDAGSVHRDLKPTNILIGPAFRAKVADFGLARYAGANTDVIAGTPEFMAPETILMAEDPALASRVDVYALGVIAFELLTGQTPFAGESMAAVLDSHVTDPIPLASEFRPELPSAFDALFRKALAKDPAQRLPSAEQFRRHLVEARRAKSSVSPPSRIAVVEDDDDFAEWLEATLAEHMPSVSTVRVRNGSDAMAALAVHRCSLVMLDLDLPGTNGIELCAQIRGNRATRDLPIVVCTGVGGPAEWKQLRELGADGFLLKPMDELTMVAEIQRLLSRRSAARAGAS